MKLIKRITIFIIILIITISSIILLVGHSHYSKALKEKPYLPELIKYVLELDEQQIEQMIEISKNVKAA